MLTVYVAGHATGSPSPGGFAYQILRGNQAVLERTQTIRRTTPTQATLTGIREVLRELETGHSAMVVTANEEAEALLTGRWKAADEGARTLCRECAVLTAQARLTIDVVHTLLDSMPILQATQQLAEEAARRAWTTANAPACPKCREQMQVKGNRWVCSSGHCNKTLRVYEVRSM